MGKKKGSAAPAKESHGEVSGRTQQQQQRLKQEKQMAQNPRGAKLPLWVGRGDLLYVSECQAAYPCPPLTTIPDIDARMAEDFDAYPEDDERHRVLPTMPQRAFPDNVYASSHVFLSDHVTTLSSISVLQDLASRPTSQRRAIVKSLVEVRHAIARLTWFGDAVRVRRILQLEGGAFSPADAQGDDVLHLNCLWSAAAAFSSVSQMAAALSMPVAGAPLPGCWQYRVRLNDLEGWRDLDEPGNAAQRITTYTAVRVAPGSEVAADEALANADPDARPRVSSMVRSGPAMPIRALMALMEASVQSTPTAGRDGYACRFPVNELPQLRFC